jgi:ketosteroid isomerase-like protein
LPDRSRSELSRLTHRQGVTPSFFDKVTPYHFAGQMDTNHSPLAALQALNKRFIHNFITNDVPAHSAIIHPDFVCISSSGARVGRAAYLHDWATDFDPEVILYWDMRHEEITLLGDVALVRATDKWVRRMDGLDITGMTCYTDTYVCNQGQWLCLQAQLTPVAAANYPPDSTIVVQYHRGVQVPVGTLFTV